MVQKMDVFLFYHSCSNDILQIGTRLFGLTLVPDWEIVASQIDCQKRKSLPKWIKF